MAKFSRLRRPSRDKRPRYALFGTIALERAYCPWCEHTALVLDGKIACCDRPFVVDPERSERESGIPPERQYIPQAKKDAILIEQGNRCAYCDLPFGATVYRSAKPIVLRLNWEHAVPWSYDGNRDVIAACHVCNGIKTDKFFRTLEEATVYVLDQRRAKGYAP